MAAEEAADAVEQVLHARARELALPLSVRDERPVELLAFTSGDVRLAVPTDRVREVLTPGPTAHLPVGTSALVGLRGTRGGVVPLIDPALLLDASGGGAAPPADRFVIVVGDATSPLGLLADHVQGVVTDARLRPAPSLLVDALTDDGILVLDVHAVINDPRSTTHRPAHTSAIGPPS